MRACVALGLVVGVLTPVVSADQDERPECHESVMTTASALLAPGAMRIRWTTNGGDFAGALSGITCDALEATMYSGRQGQTVVLRLSDLKSLQVQRHRAAGWKGGIIAIAAGAAVGAALQANDEPLRGAVIGALVLAPVGWHYPVSAWRPVEVPRDALRE